MTYNNATGHSLERNYLYAGVSGITIVKKGASTFSWDLYSMEHDITNFTILSRFFSQVLIFTNHEKGLLRLSQLEFSILKKNLFFFFHLLNGGGGCGCFIPLDLITPFWLGNRSEGMHNLPLASI